MQLLQGVGQVIGQVAVLVMVPALLHRIEFRRIGRQPGEAGQPGRPAPAQATDRGAVHAPAIQDHQQRTPRLTLKGSQEGQDVGRANIGGEETKIEAQPPAVWRARKRAHNREAVMTCPATLDRGLPARGPRTPARGLQQEATLVQENEVSLTLAGFFLAAARSGCASERWLARRARGLDARASEGSSPTPA